MSFQLSSVGARLFLEINLRHGPAFVRVLEVSFKDRARTLHKALPEGDQVRHRPGLMQVQEALAKSLGFTNMHALQRVLNDVASGLADADVSANTHYLNTCSTSLDQLVPLFRLADELKGVTQLDSLRIEELARLTELLAVHLAAPLEEVRLAVAQGWAEEPAWDRFQSRTPLDSSRDEPLITFTVEGEPSSSESKGRFRISTSGHWIWDHLLSFDDDTNPFENAAEVHKQFILLFKSA